MMNATLATVRTAYRYVVAYERRVLDGAAAIREAIVELDYQFEGWSPLRRAFPSRNNFPADRWAWDNIPMYAVRFRWNRGGRKENQGGNSWFFLDHVADTAFEEPRRSGEPDPLTTLRDASESTSVFRARWLKFHEPVSEAHWALSWDDLVGREFGCPTAEVWPLEVTTQPSERRNAALTAGGHVVAIDDLESPEHFNARLVEPVVAALRALG